MTIYHKDAKRHGYAAPGEVAKCKAEIERLRKALHEIAELRGNSQSRATAIADSALRVSTPARALYESWKRLI